MLHNETHEDTRTLISVGERPMQGQHRVTLSKDLCDAHDISQGDRVEIWIRKVK